MDCAAVSQMGFQTMAAVLVGCVLLVAALHWWYLRVCEAGAAYDGSKGSQWPAPGEWVRPLSYLEHMCSVAAAIDTFNTAQVLHLESPIHHPITLQLIRQALTILSKRVLVLQMCVGWRGWWPWYRRINTSKGVVELSESSEDPNLVYQQQLKLGYNVAEGPLWRAALVRCPPDSPNIHQFVLVLTLHHVINDGTTMMILSRDLLTIINGLVTGEAGDTPRRGLVPPVSNTLTSHWDLMPLFKITFSVLYALLLSLLGRGNACLLPKPLPASHSTNALRYNLSKQSTTQLFKRCKEWKVRVHSCILSASALAFLRTARQNGRRISSLKLNHNTSVNIRRYYSSDLKEAIGSVSSFSSLTHHVDENEDFWNLARNIQRDLYIHLDKERLALRVTQFGWIMGLLFVINKMLSSVGVCSLTYTNVTVTNMGDLRTLLPANYPGPVRITNLLRSTAGELLDTYFCVAVQTFEERLLLSLDHYTTKTTEESAKEFFIHLTQILNDIASREACQDGKLTNFVNHSIRSNGTLAPSPT